MPTDISDIEHSLHRLSQLIRREREALVRGVKGAVGPQRTASGFGPAGRGWWVLALGERLDPDDFEQREGAREALQLEVESLGLGLAEYIWVWDETGLAQLVVAACESPEEARAEAERHAAMGLATRVVRESGLEEDAGEESGPGTSGDGTDGGTPVR